MARMAAAQAARHGDKAAAAHAVSNPAKSVMSGTTHIGAAYQNRFVRIALTITP